MILRRGPGCHCSCFPWPECEGGGYRVLGLAPFGVQPWWVWGFPRLGFLPLPLGLEGSKAAVARSSRACSLLGTTELWASREISCPFRMCPSPLGGVGGARSKQRLWSRPRVRSLPRDVQTAGGRGRCAGAGAAARPRACTQASLPASATPLWQRQWEWGGDAEPRTPVACSFLSFTSCVHRATGPGRSQGSLQTVRTWWPGAC